MTAEQVIADISNLPVEEQLHVLQTVWDSMPGQDLPPVQADAKADLDRRMERYRRDPSSAMTVQQLKDRLTESRRN